MAFYWHSPFLLFFYFTGLNTSFQIGLVIRVKISSILELAKENDIYPGLITRWKSQYLYGKFHGTSASDTELRKLKLKICELEQMVGKLYFRKITF